MSILDKKLYLADLSEQLDAFLPGAQARRVLEAAGLALDGYDLSALRPEDGGRDDSDGLLRLFLDAKAIEGRSEKVLAELNQCAERKIAEILVQEGEELPKVYQDKLQKPERRSRKFPEGEATPEDDAPAPVATPSVTAASGGDSSLGEGAKRATDRDLFDAVATLLPEAKQTPKRQRPGENGVPVAPRNEDEARHWVDGVGPVPLEPDCRTDAAPTVREVRRVEVPRSIPIEALLRTACRLMASALALSPDNYHTYSCGVLDLVHALTEEV